LHDKASSQNISRRLAFNDLWLIKINCLRQYFNPHSAPLAVKQGNYGNKKEN